MTVGAGRQRDSLPGDVTMISSLLLVSLSTAVLSSPHPCLSPVGRTSDVCQQLFQLCSASSPAHQLPTCEALLDQLDSLPEEQRIDLGVAVLEPSIGTALMRIIYQIHLSKD